MNTTIKTAVAATNALLRRRQVELQTGLGRSAIYSRMDPASPSYDATFPKPVPLSTSGGKATCVRWVASEVDSWIAGLVAGRDAKA